MPHDLIEEMSDGPIGWVIGGIVSIIGVMGAVVLDPTGVVAALVHVLSAQATSIFTAASIAGFTLAPAVEWLPETQIQWIAIVFGVIVVLRILDSVWDTFKDRVDDD